jgi:predicted small lipoprotein YifL
MIIKTTIKKLLTQCAPLFVIAIGIFSQISCGVKGPPLPPLEVLPQKSEPQASPRPA